MDVWRIKRKLGGYGTFFIFFTIIVGIIAYRYWPEATCLDGVQNGDETGVDCGGSCAACLIEKIEDPIKLWTRFFTIGGGAYDVAAFIENPNVTAGSRQMRYVFRLLDSEGFLITSRSGVTELLPGESRVIFEPKLATQRRVPQRVNFDFEIPIWERLFVVDPGIVVIEREFRRQPNPTVRATLENKSLRDKDSLEATALLHDESENVFAVSETFIESLPKGARKEAVFTWPPGLFSNEPARISIIIHTSE